jgi:hypothetical protein
MCIGGIRISLLIGENAGGIKQMHDISVISVRTYFYNILADRNHSGEKL